MTVASDIVAARTPVAKHPVHSREKLAGGRAGTRQRQGGINGVMKLSVCFLCGSAGADNREVAVEITEIAVPYAPRIQHQHVASCERPFVRWCDDVVITFRPGGADKVADIVSPCGKSGPLEFTKQLGKRHAFLDPVRQIIEYIADDAAYVADLGDFAW